MATCRQTITSALRKISVVSAGQTAPSAYDAATALDVLKSLYLDAMAAGLFGRLTDVDVDADYEAQEFERVRNVSAGAVSITLPLTVTDAFTGESRSPRPGAVIVVANPTPAVNIYSAVAGDWLAVDGLTLDSVAPLSEQGPNGLACWLAVLLSEDGYGVELGPVIIRRAGSFRMAQATRFDSPRVEAASEYF